MGLIGQPSVVGWLLDFLVFPFLSWACPLLQVYPVWKLVIGIGYMVRIGQLSTLNSRQPDSLHFSYLRRLIQTPLDPPNFTLLLRLLLSNPKVMLHSYHGYSHNNPLTLKNSLSLRIERWKLWLKKLIVFPSCKVLWQIAPLHQNLGSCLSAAPNHSTIQDLLRFRQKLPSFANYGHSGSDGPPCGQTSLEERYMEDRVNLRAFW